MLQDGVFLKSSETENDIVLVFPGKFKSPNPQMPLGLIHVADPLIRAGYRVRILDMRVENYSGCPALKALYAGVFDNFRL